MMSMRSLSRTPEGVAVRQGLAVALATSAYGVSFGALSVASGLDVWQTCVLLSLIHISEPTRPY